MATLLGRRLLQSFQFKVCGVLSLVASNYNTLSTLLLLPVVPPPLSPQTVLLQHCVMYVELSCMYIESRTAAGLIT